MLKIRPTIIKRTSPAFIAGLFLLQFYNSRAVLSALYLLKGENKSMFNAKYFTYDGVFSGIYGLVLADFDDSSVIETAAFSPVLYANKPVSLPRFYHGGITYESVPQHQFSIICEYAMSDVIRRDVLSWLVGRREFKPLKIHQPDLEAYEYRCVFTDVQIIYVNGHCHGFRVTANFDSPYQHGAPSSTGELTINGKQTIQLINDSDIVDDYTYPTITFRASSPVNTDAAAVEWARSQKGVGVSNYDICVINQTDNDSRRFVFAGLMPNEEIKVDNEIKHISSSISGEKLTNFNKNWLRLRRGENILTVDMVGTVEIVCPTYVALGF